MRCDTRLARRLAFGVGLALALGAAAAEPNPLLAQAKTSYAGGDYLAAARLLERGLASGIDEPEARTDARLYLAAANFAMGDKESARRVLTALLEEAPDFKPRPELFSPPFLRALEEVRAARSQVPLREPPPPVITPAAPTLTAPAPALIEPQAGLRRRAWTPGVLGAAAVGVGVGFLVHAAAQHSLLVKPPGSPADVLSPAEATRISSAGVTAQLVGWISTLVGAALLSTSLAFLLFGGEAT